MSSPNLLKDPIQPLLWKIGLPAGMIFFLTGLFNATDAYWAGKLGVPAATAMSVTFPLFFLLTVFGNGLSNAATALLGNAIGEKKEQHISTLLEHIFFLAIILIILLTPILLGITPLILWLTGDPHPEIRDLSFAYIIPIFSFALVFLLSYLMNGILSAYGDTKTYSRTLVLGVLVNIGLDPLLMFGIPGIFTGMGIAGVAWATIFIQITTFLYLISVLRRRGIFARCHYTLRWRPERKIIHEIVAMAAPATLGMITVAIGFFVINSFLNNYESVVLAVYGVANQLGTIILLPAAGLAAATTVIVSQSHGARDFRRIRKTYFLALINGLLAVVPLAALVYIFVPTIFTAFITISDPIQRAHMVAIGRQYIFIDICTYWGYIILYITVSAMQAIEKPNFGLFIGIYRQIVLPLIVFSIVVALGGSYLGIWWSISGVNWSAAVIALVYGWYKIHRQS